MIDLRYHIYSLVAVFLALAVGMFIGQAFVPNSPVERQQNKIAQLNRMLNRMEADFRTVRHEVVSQQGQLKEYEGQLKRSDEYCRALVPAVVANRLQWKNISIVQTGDYGEDITAIKTVLEKAGARVTSVTHIKKRDVVVDPNKASVVISACQLGAEGEPCRSIVRAVAGCAAAGLYYDKLVKMRDAGVLELSGDYSRHVDYVVLLGGGAKGDTSGKIDQALIDEFRSLGATAVGCEPTDVAVSYIPTYKKAGIASVDNIDKPFGQIGLVCALAGEVASFGTKKTADRLMPQTLTGKE